MQLFNIYIFNVFTSTNDGINFKNKLYAQNLRKKWHELNLVILVPAASQKKQFISRFEWLVHMGAGCFDQQPCCSL